MKIARTVVSLSLALIVLLGLGLTASAAGPAGTWATGIQVQNQAASDSGQSATVTFRFYWKVGACPSGCPALGEPELTWTDPTPIAAGKSRVYYVPNAIPGLRDNFVGSAVVTSEGAPIAAILNTSRVAGAGESARTGSAIGVSEEGSLMPSPMLYAPYLRKDYYGYNSYIAVQNTSNSAADVSVKYYDHLGVLVSTETENIPAFSNQIFYQDANASLPAGFRGSAVIDGDGTPLAAVVNNAGSGNDADVTTAGFESNNAFTGGATKVYVPKVTVNYYDYQSGLSIQNIGNAPTGMQVEFKFGANTYTKTSAAPVGPNTAWQIFLATASASGIPAGHSGSGSAIVTSLDGQPIVVLVTERNDATGFSVVWNGLADGSGAPSVLFPKYDRWYYNYNGGIQIQNLGDQPCNICATWSPIAGVDVNPPCQGPVAPGASIFWFGPNVIGLLDNFHGSVVAYSDNGEEVQGVYISRNDALAGDTYSAYNGIAQ
jgi:hypothetical protein